jgi:hypothetical protein
VENDPREPSTARTVRTRLVSPSGRAGEGGEPPQPERVLTIRFGRLVGDLLAVREPDGEVVGRLKAGCDLLKALDEESPDFGAAAPGSDALGPDDYAARVMALTHEAFEAAWQILELAHDTPGAATAAGGGNAHLARACVDAFADGEGSWTAFANALLSCPTTPEADGSAEGFM